MTAKKVNVFNFLLLCFLLCLPFLVKGNSIEFVPPNVLSISFVDPLADKKLNMVKDGEAYNFEKYASLNILIETDPEKVSRVAMELQMPSGAVYQQVDDEYPYTLFGYVKGDYLPGFKPEAGKYMLKATPHLEVNGQEQTGETLEISFIIPPKVAKLPKSKKPVKEERPEVKPVPDVNEKPEKKPDPKKEPPIQKTDDNLKADKEASVHNGKNKEKVSNKNSNTNHNNGYNEELENDIQGNVSQNSILSVIGYGTKKTIGFILYFTLPILLGYLITKGAIFAPNFIIKVIFVVSFLYAVIVFYSSIRNQAICSCFNDFIPPWITIDSWASDWLSIIVNYATLPIVVIIIYIIFSVATGNSLFVGHLIGHLLTAIIVAILINFAINFTVTRIMCPFVCT